MADADAIARLDERELVERMRATGDPSSFAELYRRERRKVFGVCLGILRDPAEAEEVCHDAFVRAFERFQTLQGEAFAPWVCRIASNLSLNRLRSRTMAARAPSPSPAPAPAPSVERIAIAAEDLAIAREILSALRPEQRRVFLLRHLDGLSYREIAERTGGTEEAVRSHLQNARRNFHLAWEARKDPARPSHV